MSSATSLTGAQLLAGAPSASGASRFRAHDPATGAALAPDYIDATADEVARAASAAEAAAPALAAFERDRRAAFLDTIATNLEALGEPLLQRAHEETALPLARLTAERGRTTGQLRLFARFVREGLHLGVRIDHGDAERKPLPKPDLRAMARPIGPVAVFGAANFPLAFSVAGGDTAAALAAGCPVVVKGHPAHPGTSELAGRAIADAVREHGLPAGTFSLVHGAGHAVGEVLVVHPAIRAVAFTGSLRGGRALHDLAQRRPMPIPVFAEMGSTNPMFLLPARVAEDPAGLAAAVAASVTMGVGQFCTNPGTLVLLDDEAGREFLRALATALDATAEAPLLHGGIRAGYDAGLERLAALPGVQVLARGTATGPCGARGALFTITSERFLAERDAREEVFGPATLAVLASNVEDVRRIASGLDGQLTATLHAAHGDMALATELAPLLADRAGRVLFGGFPTGVEVCEAMVHGGPYPATTDSRSTSVGPTSIARFQRPVAYQNFPAELLPRELQDAPIPGLMRRVDGQWQV